MKKIKYSPTDISAFIIALGKVVDEERIFSAYVQAKLGCFSKLILPSNFNKDRELIYNSKEKTVVLTSFDGSSVKLENLSPTEKIYKLFYTDYDCQRLYDRETKTHKKFINLGHFDEKIQEFFIKMKERPQDIGLKETSISFGVGVDN